MRCSGVSLAAYLDGKQQTLSALRVEQVRSVPGACAPNGETGCLSRIPICKVRGFSTVCIEVIWESDTPAICDIQSIKSVEALESSLHPLQWIWIIA